MSAFLCITALSHSKTKNKRKEVLFMYTCSYDRMKDKIETFSKFGDAGHGGITRYSLSPAAIQARNEFKRRMEAIGATIEVDDVACMYATLPGSDPDAKRIVMGSHVDSVNDTEQAFFVSPKELIDLLENCRRAPQQSEK